MVQKDAEFLQNNTITFLVNCCGRDEKTSPPAAPVKKGQKLRVFDFFWPQKKADFLGTAAFAEQLGRVEGFLEDAEDCGECALVFCESGQNRALCVLVALLMRRFCWSFFKALEFLDSKRENLEIKKPFFNSLKSFGDVFEQHAKVSTDWKNQSCAPARFQTEESLLRNTFLNTKRLLEAKISDRSSEPTKKRPLGASEKNIDNGRKSEKQSNEAKFATSGASFQRRQNTKSVQQKKRSKSERRIVWKDQLQAPAEKGSKSVGKVKKISCELFLKSSFGVLLGKK